MTFVLDASTLITLARIGRLELLRQIIGTAHIPEAVYREVVRAGSSRPGTTEVAQAGWLVRHPVLDRSAVGRLRARVGQGEAEAIVLARELGADLLILDDQTARRIAEAEGQRVVGLLGLLLQAKALGMFPMLKPLLDEMIAADFFIDEGLYRLVLRQAGEDPIP